MSAVHWFRKGLRVHDNPALLDAIQAVRKEKLTLRPIFVLDPNIRQWLVVGANRWRFLQQTLTDLDESLRKIGTRLYVVRGKPEEVFLRVFKEWHVSVLTFESDIEPYSTERDALVESLAEKHKVEVIKRVSHTIFAPMDIIERNGGKPPLTYQKFLSVAESLGAPESPSGWPEKLPAFSAPKQDSVEQKDATAYDPPSLQELGVETAELGKCLYPGGETEGLRRMEKYLAKSKWICDFEKPKTSPNSLQPSTTVLSPYLRFGCLSSRLFYQRLVEVTRGKKHSKPPVSLIGQLMWREFYYAVAAGTPNFDRMVGNPVCLQVPWSSNPAHLEAWSYGRTGYPFIDAIMRQLRQEGWIHHLARHAVACFLTRGDLWLSWEAGQRVFEELLLDADWALNAGNWMWLSASAFFHQFFRVYSPVAFGKKTDKNGDYVRKYVPEVAGLPQEYVYEPWTAPKSVQVAAKCVVGKDYPERLVEHDKAREANLAKMSKAYKENRKAGDDKAESKGKAQGKGKEAAKRKKGQASLDNFVKKKAK